MFFRRLGYGIKEGIKNIIRNKMFSIASVGTISACVFLIGVTLALALNIGAAVGRAEESVNISVFFQNGLADENKQQIGQTLKAFSQVKKVRYVSAQEAWEKYKKDVFKNNQELLEGFEGNNPLNESDSYELTLSTVDGHEKLVEEIKGMEGVRKVRYSRAAAEGISKINVICGYGALMLVLILGFVSVFLVSNTVSMGITVRKDEIRIMRLIGAARRLIRIPFLVEGAVIGLMGAVIPTVVIYFGYEKIAQYVMEKFKVITNFMSIVPVQKIMYYLIPSSLVVGLVIGLLGSTVTIRKYLRV